MISVGVIGHRDLTGFNINKLRQQVLAELEKLKCGENQARMLNSIADGADQLCAEIGLDMGYELICPLPFLQYRRDFIGESLARYDALLKRAKETFVVSSGVDRDAAYLEAGKYIADHCDVLIAVWNQKPQISTCGSAAVVKYAREIGRLVLILDGGL